MATTVYSAFDEFLRNKVNLDPEVALKAHASKDWLLGQIANLERTVIGFPNLSPEFNIHYGSFARKTKTRPLDDIDLMIGLVGSNASYNMYSLTQATITIGQGNPLKDLCFQGTDNLSSIKVINRFVSNLKNIHQYRNADIKRNNVAAVLKLTSYDWNFDIVPCFLTTNDAYGKNFYLIPDGQGNWQKTDPRIDKAAVTQVNQRQNGNVLNLIRIIKFWNKRRSIQTIPSYLIEAIILNYCQTPLVSISKYVDLNIVVVLEYLAAAIKLPVNDPKGIQGDINSLSWEERQRVAATALEHARAARNGRSYEQAGNHSMSILYWKDVFGADFPSYS